MAITDGQSMTGQEQTIPLGDAFRGAITFGAGRVEVDAGGNIDVYTDGAIKVHPAVEPHTKPEATVPSRPKIGDMMPVGDLNAGWIYAGVSPTTLEPFYVAPEDSGIFRWNKGMKFAAQAKARLPSSDELNLLYKAQYSGALTGTFNDSGEDIAGWYWSDSQLPILPFLVWAQRFDNGIRGLDIKPSQASVRLVRS